LLILDEIGRGTSTFDGLSIAWSVIEFISNNKILGAKTLFATHYHELTELEGKLSNVNNYCIAVKEQGDDIVFLRKIIKGGADRSYGIQVAKLAGVPDLVLGRAKEILDELLKDDASQKARTIEVNPNIGESQGIQLSIFDQILPAPEHPVVEELRKLDLSRTTPLQALNLLYELQEKAGK
jgi:DNA mismatch repair protein MutS